MSAPCAHQVAFHDAAATPAVGVSSFVAVPLLRGEAVVVVATAEHRAQLVVQLGLSGVDVTAARREGRYLELDAATTLAALVPGGDVSAERFGTDITAVLTDLVSRFDAVSAYGEMVGILAAEGHVVAALRLEELWDAAVAELPLRLLCGYPSEVFAGGSAEAETAAAAVRAAHDTVAPRTTATVALRLPADARAGTMARRAVQAVCRSWGLGADEGWADDAELVVAELVGNAVRHAPSTLALSVDRRGEDVVVAVTDGVVAAPVPRSASPLAEDGRGMLIIEALADGWGVDQRPVGKSVWVQLRPPAVAA